MAQQVKNPPAMQATLETQVWSLGWEDPLEEEVAATAKSLQSCPTLCDPIDGSPPGSPVPEILQGRTLEWVAISFSKAWKWKVKVKSFSPVWLSVTPWTATHQAPPSVGFSRQESWNGVPFGNPLQYSCLENPMDRGAWRSTVHGVTESQTGLIASVLTHAHTRLSFSSDDGKRSECRKSTSTSRIQISSISVPGMDHSKTEGGPVSSTCLQALGWLIHS